MEKLIDYLLQFGNLNQQQIDLIISKVRQVHLPKDKYFSEAGKVAKEIGFVSDGILRICYYNKKGDEITKYFVSENRFVVDLDSYNAKIPASQYIQAVLDCKILTISYNDMQELSLTIINWDDIINKITTKALVDKVNIISPMVSEDASKKYLSFLEKFPQLVNRIPLSHIASYLGITQSSLSRIRKNI
ncbi:MULTISPECIES: Crp/Fnr family transcriptional regulator [Flavobacterium]|uniref:Crp/Fnr family transcriptional regulator n=1 Tax=Flavobacterium jumunjinense TaxID=998845 RepID=A0ABV5GK50_9FLAO|nr:MULTISPECIES: Crp/Fnr family transcriptional regulator [Flavobacterium]